jgi:hypothetical protein
MDYKVTQHLCSGEVYSRQQMYPKLTQSLGLAKSQQSVTTSFGKVVCERKAAELDFPSSVPKTGLYREYKQSQSILCHLSLRCLHELCLH